MTRNERIALEVVNGSTLASVGREYSITPERVRQISYKIYRNYIPGLWAMCFDLKSLRRLRRRATQGIIRHAFKAREV